MRAATDMRPTKAAPAPHVASNVGNAHEYLTFRLGPEEYAIDILRAREIRGYGEPTRLANAPECIKGVINLRGVIVPILDLRIHFGLINPSYDSFTVVIVLNVCNRIVGMVVDSVTDVVSLSEEHLRPVPDVSASVEGDFVTSIGSLAGRMLILLDIERVATSASLGLVSSAAH